jgi:hypothetical protein
VEVSGWLLDLAIVATVIGIATEVPVLLLNVLKLRRKWREEFPPKTLEQQLAEVEWERITPNYMRNVGRVLVFRLVTAVANLATLPFLAGFASSGDSRVVPVVAGFDVWVLAWLVVTPFFYWYVWPLVRAASALKRLEREAKNAARAELVRQMMK